MPNYIKKRTPESEQTRHPQDHQVQPVQSSSSLVDVVPKRQKIRTDSNNSNENEKSGDGADKSSRPRWKNNNSRGYNNRRRKSINQSKMGANHQNYQNNYQQERPMNSTMPTTTTTTVQTRSTQLSDIPGYSYDPKSNKYFKVLPNKPGQPAGSTLQHLRYLAVKEAAVLDDGAASKYRCPAANSLPKMLARFQLSAGGAGHRQQMGRFIEERTLRAISPIPSYTVEVVDNWSQRFDSCQFMDVSEDGKTLLGCWSTTRPDIFSAQCSRVLSFDVKIDRRRAKQDARLLDENPQKLYDTDGQYSCNTYGLHFEPLDNGICLETSSQVLVDMVLAPADRDVTCLLFATASSFYRTAGDGGCPKITTKCVVCLRPIEFNLTEEGRESMGSPIYNAEWTSAEPIWSICFNPHHMKICVGMEKNARILNVLTGQSFFVSSGARNVISCTFSKDGNSLLLGRKNANISLLDLRMRSNHPIGDLPGSLSADFVHLLREQPNTLLSENFEGKIKLWDLRMRRELNEMEAGHRNSSHKLPCFVDSAERLVFAVGEDAVVRGWSLHTGELLCSVNSPRAHLRQKECRQGSRGADPTGVDFPRVAYSSSWGGRVGNSALIFAVNGDMLVHELLI